MPPLKDRIEMLAQQFFKAVTRGTVPMTRFPYQSVFVP